MHIIIACVNTCIWPANINSHFYLRIANEYISFGFSTVPPPTLSVTAPSPQRVGQSLTLTCSVTAVRGITSSVDIIWRSGGEVLNRTNNTSPTMRDSSLVFTDLYTIPQLWLCSVDQDVYQCEVVINTSPSVIATDNVRLEVMGENETSTTAYISY